MSMVDMVMPLGYINLLEGRTWITRNLELVESMVMLLLPFLHKVMDKKVKRQILKYKGKMMEKIVLQLISSIMIN